MPQLNNIIDVTISKSTPNTISDISTNALIIGNSVPDLQGKVKSYTSLTTVASDFATDTAEYKMAANLFGQSVRMPKIYIGQVEQNQTFIDAYTAIKNIKSDFYGVLLTSNETDDILAISQAVEAEPRLFVKATSQEGALTDANNNNILKTLNGLNRIRTAIYYHDNADNIFPDSALLGRFLPVQAGSIVWRDKVLSGVTANNLTDAQIEILDNRNGLYSIIVTGTNAVTRRGRTVGGEKIDVLYGLDWLTLHIKEIMYNQIFQSDKIPYTYEGIKIVESNLKKALLDGVANSIINPDFTISTPDINSIPASDKNDEILRNVKFNATLTGSIGNIVINGNVLI